MSLLDALKGLFPNLKSFFDIHGNNVNIQLFSCNKKIIVNKDTIRINPGLMAPKERKAIAQFINQAIEEENCILIEEKADAIIRDVISCEQLPETTEKIAFIKEAFPEADFQIWRAGIYLAKCFHSGDKKAIVSKLKQDMVQRYGKRGGNIANICSAGYLENYLIPLYQDLEESKPKEAKEKFREIYNLVIEQSAFAIFVSQYHTSAKLQNEIETKITINSQYGIHLLNIHAIGRTNIKMVEEVLTKMADKYTVFYREKTERTVFATITPKVKSLTLPAAKPT